MGGGSRAKSQVDKERATNSPRVPRAEWGWGTRSPDTDASPPRWGKLARSLPWPITEITRREGDRGVFEASGSEEARQRQRGGSTVAEHCGTRRSEAIERREHDIQTRRGEGRGYPSSHRVIHSCTQGGMVCARASVIVSQGVYMHGEYARHTHPLMRTPRPRPRECPRPPPP